MSFDSVAANAAFARKESFPFPLLSDVGRECGLAYGACDTPDARSARRISYVIGWDPSGTAKILAAYPAVSPASHAREVLDFLSSKRA